MIFKQPKPLAKKDDALERACAAGDDIALQRMAQYMIDELAERIETQEQLESVLGNIEDPEQRYIVLDKLTPMLKFKPEGLIKEA